jgi:hypothetical protein
MLQECQLNRAEVRWTETASVTIKEQRGPRQEMFNTLDDEIKRDNQATTTARERRLFYAVVLLVSGILFSGLYAGIKYLE